MPVEIPTKTPTLDTLVLRKLEVCAEIDVNYAVLPIVYEGRRETRKACSIFFRDRLSWCGSGQVKFWLARRALPLGAYCVADSNRG